MKKVLFFVAAAIVALTSCKDAKQSELSLDAKAGEAVITGQVVYDAGYVQEGDEIVKVVKPLESGKVVVTMAYSEMGTGEGIRQFTGDIVNGVYAINVPVNMKSVEVTLKIEPFMGVYGDLNAKNEIVATEAFFRANNAITVVGLVVNETRKLDIIKMKADKMFNPTREQEVTIAGEVEKESISDGSMEPFANAELFVYVTYEDKELIYNVATNKDGEYKLSMMLYDDWSLDKVNVKVEKKFFTEIGKNSLDEKVEATYETISVSSVLNYAAYTEQEMPKMPIYISKTKPLE